MRYCLECGHKLILRNEKQEGDVLYCEECQMFRYEPFSTAISIVVVHPNKDQVLLIQQYGRPSNILVAGYINKGECAEEAVDRELMEEIGLSTSCCQYLGSEYFPKTNTLMLSYTVLAVTADLKHMCDWEVDQAAWFSFDDAYRMIRRDSLAQRFLFRFLNQWEKGLIMFSK